jgi:hypothetical protein
MKILTGFALLLTCSAYADDAVRTELKRSDITGTNMEMVISITEAKPGDTIPRHSHHGEEGTSFKERPWKLRTANKSPLKKARRASTFGTLHMAGLRSSGIKLSSC